MKWVELDTLIGRYFEERPGERSLRRQLKAWEKEGMARKMAGSWYIDEHKFLANGDPLVEQALAG